MSAVITLVDFAEILAKAEAEILVFFEELAAEKRWPSLQQAVPALGFLRRAGAGIEAQREGESENSDGPESPAGPGGGWRTGEEKDRLHFQAIVGRAQSALLGMLLESAEAGHWEVFDASFPALPLADRARRTFIKGIGVEAEPRTATQDNRTDKVNDPATGGPEGMREIPLILGGAVNHLRQAETEFLRIMVEALGGSGEDWRRVDLLFSSLLLSHQARVAVAGRFWLPATSE